MNFTKLDKIQTSVIDESMKEKNKIVSVCGAAGTGKTTVIVNLALNLILSGKRVLICSKTDNATDVIYNRLVKFGQYVAMRAGDRELLSDNIDNILEKKIVLQEQTRGFFAKISPAERLNDKINQILKFCMDDKETRQALFKYRNSMYWTNGKKVCDETFEHLLNLLPCWCVNTLNIAEAIPLKQDLFDVVIFDEASQCDIATSLPALYRAKRAVIIGDNKQLKHISFLSKKKEQSFFTKNDVEDSEQIIWRYRTNSLYDWALFQADKQIMLKNQYRMPENLFNFSNSHFYNKSITTCCDGVGGLNIINIDGKTDEGKSRNFAEVEAITKWLKENVDGNTSTTYAVISPFVEQVKLLDKVLNKVLPTKQIDRVKISTIYGMQGDEADNVLISWVYSDNSPRQLQTFINKPNLFNVAITRAKKNVYSFVSFKSSAGLLKEFVEV